jgi:hypothetical protein
MLVVACARPTPVAPPPPPPPPNVPAGCLGDLSGAWVHATDPSYRYDATDDGGTLTLVVSRFFAVDAGFRPRQFRLDAGAPDAGPLDAGHSDAGRPPADGGLVDDGGPAASSPDDAGVADAGPVTVLVILERTTHGFVGETRASLDHPSGRRCEAHFHTEVLSCGDAGLQLTTDTAASLGEDCQPPARAQSVPRAEQRLIRPP